MIYYLCDDTEREYLELGEWTGQGWQLASDVIARFLLAAKRHKLSVIDVHPPVSWIRCSESFDNQSAVRSLASQQDSGG